MKRLMLGCALLLLGSTTVLATPPGLMKQDKVPAGFSQGEKTGWQGAGQPPGWEKSRAGGTAPVDSYGRGYMPTDERSGGGKGKAKGKGKGKK